MTSRFLWLAPYTNEILDVDTSKMEPKGYERMVPKIRQEGAQIVIAPNDVCMSEMLGSAVMNCGLGMEADKRKWRNSSGLCELSKCRSTAVRAADTIRPSSKKEQVCSVNAGANFWNAHKQASCS